MEEDMSNWLEIQESVRAHSEGRLQQPVQIDETNIRSRSLNANKCPIYIHHCPRSSKKSQKKTDLHQSPCRKNCHFHSDKRIGHASSCTTYIRALKPFLREDTRESNPIMDKLEESYWANWRPTKSKSPTRIRKRETKIKQSCDLPSPETLPIEYKQTNEVALQSDTCDLVPLLNQPIEDCSPPSNHSLSIKHTDSLILTAKKQMNEHTHYQQPQCIKLFKNEQCPPKLHLRGGSYPLKSCLKKEQNEFCSPLGLPGTPVRSLTVTGRR